MNKYGVMPMLEFTNASVPLRADERPRRRRKGLKTPKNPKVRAMVFGGGHTHIHLENNDIKLAEKAAKWVRTLVICLSYQWQSMVIILNSRTVQTFLKLLS